MHTLIHDSCESSSELSVLITHYGSHKQSGGYRHSSSCCHEVNTKKGAYSSSWNSPQNYGTPLVNKITQCYLPPDRGNRPAFTPTGQVGTRFIDPVRMKGWVGLDLHRNTKWVLWQTLTATVDGWALRRDSNRLTENCSFTKAVTKLLQGWWGSASEAGRGI